MTPKEVVERWVELFNAGDADALVTLYHDDAVNHQVAETLVDGRAAIHDMFRREFATAEMTCIPEVVHEAGDVAILEWRDPAGLRGCGFFTVREGRIVSARLLGQALASSTAQPAHPARVIAALAAR